MSKKRKTNYLNVIAGIALVLLVCLAAYTVTQYYYISSAQKQYTQNLEQTEYQYHCAFITSSSLQTFWDSVYSAAKEEGAEYGIYVEDFGKNLSVSYSTDELLKMAIAAKVDAIIIEGSDKYTVTELMDEAAESGIAVSTIYRDNMDSTRYSYTGVNNVSIGYDYGSLAIKYSQTDNPSVLVVIDSQDQTAESRLMISGIGQALGEKWEDAQINTMTVDASNTFEMEEDLRQYLKDNHDNIDTIICTNLTQTQFLCQIAVDLNYVGDFTVIGTYQNDTILEYISSGVISGSIVIDSAEMGKKAVDSLAEYLETGHSSDYSQVNVYTIEQADAAAILKDSESSDTDGGDAK